MIGRCNGKLRECPVDVGGGTFHVVAIEKKFFKADGSQVQRSALCDTAVFKTGAFGRAAADVDGDRIHARQEVGAGDAAEIALFFAADHFDAEPKLPLDAAYKIVSIGGVADGGRGDAELFSDVVGCRDGDEVAQCEERAFHCGILKIPVVFIGVFTDAYTAFDLVQQVKGKTAGLLEDDHTYRVRTDIDHSGTLGH